MTLSVTWWGHSSMSIRIGTVCVATDPLLTRTLFHLRRPTPAPPPEAARADVVLISHLHRDHLHLPSLNRFAPDVPVVVPAGSARLVKGLADGHELLEVSPGDRVELAGLRIDVLPAHHDGRRSVLEPGDAPAVGFRVDGGAEGGTEDGAEDGAEDGGDSVWYPGDTGMRDDFSSLEPVSLACVPIGGWGPTLGDEHLDPAEAAKAVAQVGAQWALAVHYGTFWPVALRRVKPANHDHFFVTPPERFRAAMTEIAPDVVPLTPAHGELLDLVTPDSGAARRG